MKHISDKKRYSIITNDLSKCIICGRPRTDLHEIFGGRNRQNSKDYGLVIPLCHYHHNGSNDGIHFNKQLMDHWHREGQRIFEEQYINLEFIKIFYKNYL